MSSIIAAEACVAHTLYKYQGELNNFWKTYGRTVSQDAVNDLIDCLYRATSLTSEEKKAQAIAALKTCYKVYCESLDLGKSLNHAYLDKAFNRSLGCLKGSRDNCFHALVEIFKGIEAARIAGRHVDAARQVLAVIEKLKTIQALTADEITEVVAHFVLSSAYGFFLGDKQQSLLYMGARLEEISVRFNSRTPYYFFVLNTIRHQIITNELRSLQPFDPIIANVKYGRNVEFAAQAAAAKSSGMLPIVQGLPQYFGANCNAAIEGVYRNFDISDELPIVYKSSQQLLGSDIDAALEAGRDEMHSRLALCLAEAHLANGQADAAEAAWIQGLNSKNKMDCQSKSLDGKAFLIEARIYAVNGNLSAAISHALDAKRKYSEFGAHERSMHADHFVRYWSK